MKLTIRLSTETSFTLTIPDNSTVDDLKNSIIISSPNELPKDFKLIYNGSKLQPYYQPLSHFGIDSSKEVSIILMSDGTDTPPITPTQSSDSIHTTKTTTATTIKKTKKKNKCTFSNCNGTPLRMVGNCSHCGGQYCTKHRLLEDHLCTGLQICKNTAHERNAMKLNSEKTLSTRV